MIGLIVKAISSFYYVDFENTVYECKARGNFRKMGVSPVVGDYVEFSPTDLSHGVIEEIKPRKNCLSRPVIANIDKIIIVSSFSCPSPDTLIIDRLTAVAVYYGIEPIIVFNKSDTGDFSEYKKIYQNAGFKVFVVSAKDNIGIDDLRKEIGSSFCAFAGNSGVGKSSIINCLFGDLNLRTGEVSQKLGRGRHTTRSSEIYELFGGEVVDTPGFSSLEIEKIETVLKEDLQFCFRDFEPFLNECRFSSCSHTKEKGCAVIKAVEDGKIEFSRFESYKMLYDQLKDLKQWQLKN